MGKFYTAVYVGEMRETVLLVSEACWLSSFFLYHLLLRLKCLMGWNSAYASVTSLPSTIYALLTMRNLWLY